MRPDTGVQPSPTEKNMISSRPHQKIGMEYPARETPITPWSNSEPRFRAAITPASTPRVPAKINAAMASSRVAGNRVRNSCQTPSRVRSDSPRSPWASLPM
ncbi:hypothetical protein D9M72_384970 [compost metagenome]